MTNTNYISIRDLRKLLKYNKTNCIRTKCLKVLIGITGESLGEVTKFFINEWEPAFNANSLPSIEAGVKINTKYNNIDGLDKNKEIIPLRPAMYLVGRAYKQLDGNTTLVIGTTNIGTSYETVYSIDSMSNIIHRYNRRDFGRCTGTDHDNPDPRNFVKLSSGEF